MSHLNESITLPGMMFSFSQSDDTKHLLKLVQIININLIASLGCFSGILQGLSQGNPIYIWNVVTDFNEKPFLLDSAYKPIDNILKYIITLIFRELRHLKFLVFFRLFQ